MIRNGLYSLNAGSRDGVAEDVGGVLMLRDGQLHGGDAYVYYTGSYECAAGNWQGKMTSQEHTPTTRPMAAKVQHIGFFGTYNDAGAKVVAMASLASKAFDTMQRRACWWQTKFDITRPKFTIRYGQARAVWRFPLLRVERTWLGRGPRSEFDPTRTSRVDASSCATVPRARQDAT
jgi:hypothetical protein